MMKLIVEKVVGIVLIIFGLILIFRIEANFSFRFLKENISNQTGAICLSLSSVLIIMTGAYLIKNKE